LHNPPALQALEEARKNFPQAAHVAVFDTAFFRNLPERAFIYPVPYRWFTDWGIRRFGFHGINHEYCTRRATEMTSVSRLIICHLGSGCSATAVHNGQPVATTMGFTPMEGLMMGTRAGSIDSGILIYLAKQRGLTIAQLEHALNQDSGLLGISGCSSDYREMEKAAAEGNPRAKLASLLFEDRVVSTIGSLAALLGGVDALIFTAGTGEHRARLRAAVCDRLRWMGVELDRDRNASAAPDIDIAAENSAIRVLVIRAREDLMIAQVARKLSV
jgi:acetate kinase